MRYIKSKENVHYFSIDKIVEKLLPYTIIPSTYTRSINRNSFFKGKFYGIYQNFKCICSLIKEFHF